MNFMSKRAQSVRKKLSPLASKPDSEINFSDIPATTQQDWLGAVRGPFYRPLKQQLSVRIDIDVLEWLKIPGKGYQSRINQILRAAMLEQLRHS